MGQNLLVDANYLTRIVESAGPWENDNVVEIGAGLGVLTSALADAHAQVWALEMDSGFYRVLEERFRGRPEIHLIHQDATKFDFESLYRKIGRLKVVANLPYSVSSRMLFSFMEKRAIFESLTILLQKEVALRLISEAGQKEYGVLSVLTQASANPELLFDIPPRAFYPKPQVDSTLVRIIFPEGPPASADDWSLMTRLVKAGFSSRRKTLLNNLSGKSSINVSKELIRQAAQSADIDLARRAETLSPREFADFANAIKRLDT
jgi:16S rRNA (adenine1518-N6/adenine1519-N6)-dimethyltransferase